MTAEPTTPLPIPEGLIECIQAWLCNDCDALMTEMPGDGPLYECTACGRRFSRSASHDGESHRCPDCMKFSTKISEICCSECEEGAVEETTAYQCSICNDLYTDDTETEAHVRGEHGERLAQGLPMFPPNVRGTIARQDEDVPLWGEEEKEAARDLFYKRFGVDLMMCDEQELREIDLVLFQGHSLVTLLLEGMVTS